MSYVAVGAVTPQRSEFQNAAPPMDYAPPLPNRAGTATPESKFGLALGIGLAVAVVGVGGYLIFKD